MLKNRILPAAVAAALVLTGTGCVPEKTTKAGHATNPGNKHRVDVFVEATVGGRRLTLPIHLHADVTIVDGEHGISSRSHHPYPDRWDAHTGGAPTIIYYWSGSNPTTFTLGATLDASAIQHMAPHQQIILACTIHKDGRLIHVLDERSHAWEAITVSQAQSGAIKSIGVLCVWVDAAAS